MLDLAARGGQPLGTGPRIHAEVDVTGRRLTFEDPLSPQAGTNAHELIMNGTPMEL